MKAVLLLAKMLAYVSHRLGNTRSSICCIACLFGRHRPWDGCINGGAINTNISSNTFQHWLNSKSTNITWSFYELHSDYVPNLQIIYLINTDLYPNDFVFNHCGFWIKIANDTEPRWWDRKYCLLIFMTPCAGDHLIMMFPSSAGFCGAADQIACLFHMVEFNP